MTTQLRHVTEAEYRTARDALAIYDDFCRPHTTRTGWVVIPADAPRPIFRGDPLSEDRVNAYATDVEIYDLSSNMPARFCAYVTGNHITGHKLTTWTGEVIGRVVLCSSTTVHVVAAWGDKYWARRGKGDFVNLTRFKGA